MTRLSVAVVGAGIGGLAAALALAADGHEVAVFERRTGFGEGGAGIQLSPNAVRALAALGVAPPRNAVEPAGITIRSLRSGRVLGEVPLGPAMRARHGSPYLVATRSELHTSLLDAARSRPGIRLLVGRSLAALSDTPDGAIVTVEGSGGDAEARFDLAVGADGIGSAARAALGDTRPLRPSGHVAARGLLAVDALPPGLPADRTSLWLGRARHVVHYPVEGSRRVNVVVVEPGLIEPERGWSEPVDGIALQGRFAEGAPALRALLSGVEAWMAWPLADLPARRMHGRRLALVGDAAHPILPYFAQGGAIALEDAVVLADTVRTNANIAVALAAYGRARLPRIRRVQEAARRNGRIFHLGGLPAVARDLALAAMGPDAATRRYDWLYGWRPPGEPA